MTVSKYSRCSRKILGEFLKKDPKFCGSHIVSFNSVKITMEGFRD